MFCTIKKHSEKQKNGHAASSIDELKKYSTFQLKSELKRRKKIR